MGGSDSRIFSKRSAVELKSKGCKYSKHKEYGTGSMLPETFKAALDAQEDIAIKADSKEKLLLVFCGFYGYFFSMIIFREFWKSIRIGKPMSLAKIRTGLAKLLESIDSALLRLEEGGGSEGLTSDLVSSPSSSSGGSPNKKKQASSEAVDPKAVELLMNNKDRGDPAEVLLSKRNICQYARLFIDCLAEKVGEKNVAGVLIDNKIGCHVKKHVSKAYIKAFNQHSSYLYEDLDQDGTFGTDCNFTWAIPLGLSDDIYVPMHDKGGTSALWARREPPPSNTDSIDAI
jgi:hypothetical protein